jgi:serine/threonine protein phosphatase PrpC
MTKGSSESKKGDEQAEETEIAKKQRRRLSVAPQHVGDITKDASKPAERKDDEDEGLTELEMKSKGKYRFAVKSKKGIVPYNKNKVNQDRSIVKWALGDDQDLALFGVMDGHGEFGHYVAEFVREKLPEHLGAEKELKHEPEKYITLGVKKMCEKLSDTTINIAFSGTTTIFGVLVNKKLYVSNIGDSRCVLCRQGDDGEIQAIALSVDQKPENPKEKARILRAGGRVEPLPGPPGEDTGPPRVWLAEVDVPGLAMSRSIGDEVSQTVGVISVPEIIEHDIQPNDIFAIWASDGVWEFLSNQEVCGVVWKYKHDYKEAAEKLVEEAHKRWKQEEEVVDDITCVIVGFNDARDVTSKT